ncbi:AMP-binding protein [Actinokineospora sp. NPDC004072]
MGSDARFAVTSPGQDGLWYLTELAPDSPAHTLCRAWRVSGPLDVAGLRAAWRSVLARHESLRCAVVDRAGRPELLVAVEPAEEAWSCVDLGGGDAAAAAFCAELAAAPLPPAAAPLARLAVAKVGADDHVVALVAHRLVCDEESLGIVAAELAGVSGEAPKYTDFALEERIRDQRGLLDWWRAELSPPPAAPDLPVDHVRPPVPWAPAGVVRFDWGLEVPPTTVLAAFHALLHRYGGGDRIAVGMAASVRPPEFASAVGLFENLVVPCVDFTGAPTFQELVARVEAAVDGALSHAALPFEELVRGLGVDREAHRVPFGDVLFGIAPPAVAPRLPGVEVAEQPVDPRAARATLALSVAESGGAGVLEYRADVFEPSSVRLLLDQLHTLLTAALADPDAPVAALPLETEVQLEVAARAADRIADGPAGPDAVNTLVHRIARATPDAPALSSGGTYAELVAEAGRVAAALAGAQGQPVAVRMAAGPRQIAAVLGVLDAGAHLVCLGADEMGERGRALLADTRPARLVVDGAAGPDALARWYAEELDGQVVDLADLPEQQARAAAPSPGDRAYIAFTSGSTGRPKGIPQTHATLAQFATWFAGEFGIGPGARVAQWAAPGYDAALCEAFAALVAGATLCPVPDRIRANPEKITAWLADEGITHFQTVPSFAREVLRVVTAGARLDLSHLLLAGEALPGELADGLRAALPGTRLVNLYGPTELVLATWHEVGPVGRGVTPVGRSIPGRQVLVLDAQDRPCPAGVTGDIVVRSPFTTPGYLGSDDRAPFTAAGYRTGDLGRRRFDGALEFRGRKDTQVKFNGIRLELGDIESALAGHGSVAECAVVAVADGAGVVTRLVAYVVPARGPDGTATGAAAQWRAALRERFGKAMPPVTFRTLLGLPRNTGGKIDRRGLPDPGVPGGDAGRAAESWVEQDLAAIWAELGVRPGHAEDTFFAAGGHSLLVPVLLHAVRSQFGVPVAVPEFLTDPTVAGLAARVEAGIARADRRRTPH